MKADLHVHSHYSDGSDSVEEVIKQAKHQNVTHLSFVDHDTVTSLPEAMEQGQKVGIHIIPGIEISAYDFKRNRKVHVLGYGYDTQARYLTELCQAILHRRHTHSLWQIDQLNAHGYHMDKSQVIDTAKPSSTIYKQHIMKQLTDAPYSSETYQSLYRSLFKGDGPASGDIVYADVYDAVRAIKQDGGLAVIAHPGQLNSYNLIPELLEVGLDGIERNHPDHQADDHSKVERLAHDYNLFVTGGSDYHGQFGTPVIIGSQPKILSKHDRLFQHCK
ncbi:PHP domain-containing protein [Alkalicoccobacillus murimartini]|uniref:Metal-dependent phosphoesterase TrpH n=1 Tax=Alkalicoccobacillus murimartini TaxID=171685 RepID=A0ABT9YGZ5_9BACI|nr:PHP domain-containing protein [Alkalicoccobacillus murimartini]MDQ0206966.1 putative metal-dependent phosphoesterase TrpH [Alkalicoccobacillus murimartini]